MWRLGILLLTLSGCAHLNQPQEQEVFTSVPPAHWAAKKEALSTASAWSMQGTLVFKQQTHEKSSGGRGNFSLKQNGPETRLVVIGPLGSGTLQLHQTATSALFIFPDNQRLEGKSADVLWLQQGGSWPLPFSPGAFWLRGLPDEKATHLQWDQKGILRSFESHGFLIQYEAYQERAPYACPERIQIHGHSTLIKIMVNHWEGLCTHSP